MSGFPPDGENPWAIRGTRTVIANPWLEVVRHDARHRGGVETDYLVARMKKHAVGVVPLFEDGRVAMVGQWRLPHARYSWEIPEGGMEAGEDPESGVLRELAEETGLRAGQVHALGEADLSNLLTDEKASLFLAFDLSEGESAPDASEELKTARPTFAEVSEAIFGGRVRDAMTIMALGLLEMRARRGALPQEVVSALRRGGAAV